MPAHVDIIRMDADSTKGKDAHKELLEQFDASECAVLVGTQMIAKGLDFPEVTLVGVVNADYALKMPDFRAQERAYDLLEQVAGRAGRGEVAGEVVIQTYLPQDPVIRAVASHDRSIFTAHDLAQRSEALYPPYVRLTNVLVWGADLDATKRYIGRLSQLVRERFQAECELENPLSLTRDPRVSPIILGPTPCVLERAKDRFRFHFIVKSPVGYHVSEAIGGALSQMGSQPGINVSVDVDAYDLL